MPEAAPVFLILAEGMGLGLATGPYCTMACGPVLLPYLLSFGAANWLKNIFLLVKFLSGRLSAYLLVSVLASALGDISGGVIPPILNNLLILASGIYLFLIFLPAQGGFSFFREHCIIKKFAPAAPYILGFLTGISPCPPFIAGIVRVFTLKNLFLGIVYFSGFFAASTLFLLPVIFVTPFLKSERVKSIGGLTMALVAGWLVFLGAKGLLGF